MNHARAKTQTLCWLYKEQPGAEVMRSFGCGSSSSEVLGSAWGVALPGKRELVREV